MTTWTNNVGRVRPFSSIFYAATPRQSISSALPASVLVLIVDYNPENPEKIYIDRSWNYKVFSNVDTQRKKLENLLSILDTGAGLNSVQKGVPHTSLANRPCGAACFLKYTNELLRMPFFSVRNDFWKIFCDKFCTSHSSR